LSTSRKRWNIESGWSPSPSASGRESRLLFALRLRDRDRAVAVVSCSTRTFSQLHSDIASAFDFRLYEVASTSPSPLIGVVIGSSVRPG
jgi:hypothetical protein